MPFVSTWHLAVGKFDRCRLNNDEYRFDNGNVIISLNNSGIRRPYNSVADLSFQRLADGTFQGALDETPQLVPVDVGEFGAAWPAGSFELYRSSAVASFVVGGGGGGGGSCICPGLVFSSNSSRKILIAPNTFHLLQTYRLACHEMSRKNRNNATASRYFDFPPWFS